MRCFVGLGFGGVVERRAREVWNKRLRSCWRKVRGESVVAWEATLFVPLEPILLPNAGPAVVVCCLPALAMDLENSSNEPVELGPLAKC